MSSIEIRELEDKVMKLDVHSRAALAQKLLDSLDNLSEEENQDLWLREACRRREEIAQGKVQTLDGEEVLRGIEAELQ